LGNHIVEQNFLPFDKRGKKPMGQFVVSARKYRPQRFDEVVGQSHVTGTLRNALQQDHLAHAFLFCGPRGVGKTTCARILAKVLNCQEPTPEFEPCNACASCQAFHQNASFNITELDAASNNRVEHIRALIEQVRFQPQHGKYKVFIIDEVHMLSQQAFNAFLKTLEEPPPYALFILATTEKHKIIPTILSRCQIFDFRRIQVPDMISHLQSICTQEGVEAEDAALHVIAEKADGALRDALSILDRMTSFSGSSLTYVQVIDQLNVLDHDYFFKVTEALMAEDFAYILNIFAEILHKGFEPDTFIDGLASHFRNLLVCKDSQTVHLLEVSEQLKERYALQAQLAPQDFLLSLLHIANECDVHYRTARLKRLHVELYLMKMSYVNKLLRTSPVVLNEGAEKKKLEPKPNPSAETVIPSATPTSQQKEPPSAPVKQTIRKKDASASFRTSTKSNPGLSVSLNINSISESALDRKKSEEPEIPLTQDLVQNAWLYATEAVTSKSLQASMGGARVSFDESDTILLEVGRSVSRDTLIHEQGQILAILRSHLRFQKLKMQVQVDESLVADEEENEPPAPKQLTIQEKYLKMNEVNPMVEELRNRFKLKVDS
jgi:DNA polymerase-3 subunit gamma/tau